MKGRAMSRADFLSKVEQLLGKFDSESYMRGFQAGRERLLEEITEILKDDTYHFTRLNVTMRMDKLRKRRKRNG
jgi:hypothetical protein